MKKLQKYHLLLFWAIWGSALVAQDVYPYSMDCSQMLNYWNPKTAKVEMKLDPDVGHDQPGAICIIVAKDHQGENGCYYIKKPLTPGLVYKATVWSKGKNLQPDSRLQLRLAGRTETIYFDKFAILADELTEDWVKYEIEGRAPVNCKPWDSATQLQLMLDFQNLNGGTIWFDDIEIMEREYVDPEEAKTIYPYESECNKISFGLWGNNKIEFSNDKRNGHNDKPCWKAVVSEDNPKQFSSYFRDIITVIPGKNYRISYWAKAENYKPEAKTRLLFSYRDIKGKHLLYSTPIDMPLENIWKKYQYEITIPTVGKLQDCRKINILIGFNDCHGATVMVDDIIVDEY